MNINAICDFSSPKYLFISENVPSLVYYSHIPLILISIIIVSFILLKSKNKLHERGLLLILIPFSLWLFFSLISWTSNRSDVIMTVWAFTILVEPIIFIGGLYLAQTLIGEKDITFKQKLLIGLMYLPIVVLLPTTLNLSGFNLLSCQSTEGPIAQYYSYIVEYFYIGWMVVYGIKQVYKTSDKNMKKKMASIVGGLLLFLLVFSIGNIVGSFTGNWKLGALGLLGMPLFISSIIYNILTFNLFNLRVISRDILVFSLWILIGSIIFIKDISYSQIVTAITFAISIILGIILIKSARKEASDLLHISSLATSLKTLNDTLEQKVAEQTQEIRKAYDLEKKAHRELEKLNETKNQFIMIAQHNLRVPVTNVKNKLDSMISDLPRSSNEETKKTIDEAKISIDHLLHIADDFKEIANLKVGSQILNISKTNLKPLLENILQELKIDIDNTNLRVTYPTNDSAWPEMKIDSHKIREVMQVIVENAIRYNIQNGNIEIKTENKNEMFEMIVENTGVGITTEEKENLLERAFYRGKRAQIKNPVGMGIGLSLSRSIVEAHHGNLNIESGGENMGAKVTVTLPINYQFS